MFASGGGVGLIKVSYLYFVSVTGDFYVFKNPARPQTPTLWARRSGQIVNQQQVTARYIIKDTFKITGRGLVLAGHIDEGEIYLGDFIEFIAFDKRRKRKITGIEGIRKADPDKTNTGLLIKCEDETEIDELRTWRPDNEVGQISKE